MENDVTLLHCLVLDNRVETSGDNALGGGVAIAASATNCLIANSVLAGNQSLHEGGGLYLDINTHSIHLLNCTITENSAPDSGSGIMAYGCDHTINNSIVYGNAGASDLSMTFPDDVWYTNSCVPSTAGNGHFVHAVTNDPHFQTEPRGMIAADSPCRDQGATSLTNSSTDAACRPRVINDVVDIGAYEFQRWVLTSTCGELIFPDDPPSVTNGNGSWLRGFWNAGCQRNTLGKCVIQHHRHQHRAARRRLQRFFSGRPFPAQPGAKQHNKHSVHVSRNLCRNQLGGTLFYRF